MAEPGDLGIDRRLLYAVSAIIIVIALFFVFSLRSCGGQTTKDNGYITIYSDLDLRDAANVVARLKEIKIPYEIKDDGRAISVPKERSSEARLGLAEKNLPLGGSVGWEIFDESKLGATDFERRVQFIRAISGELSRTIRKIEAVDDCRVQIVIPETRLFEVTKTPVTASVLLRMRAGMNLKPQQISGIIHLVASSVENLKTENVTIVDDRGNILSSIINQSNKIPTDEEISQATKEVPSVIKIVTMETIRPQTTTGNQPAPKPISEEERMLLRLKVIRETETQYESLCQALINRFYPPNSALVKVNLVLGGKTGSIEGYAVKRVMAIVLVDSRFNLTPALKKDTFTVIGQSIGYDESRGDRIIIKKVPFQFSMSSPEQLSDQVNRALPYPPAPKPGRRLSLMRVIWDLLDWKLIGEVVFGFIVLIIILRWFRSRRKKSERVPFQAEQKTTAGSRGNPIQTGVVEDIRNLANFQPERLANLLKSWLTEK